MKISLPNYNNNFSDLAYQGGNINSLQILKALCALAVVQIHTESCIRTYAMPFLNLAVPIFFMITGYFLLTKVGALTTDRIKHTIIKAIKITAITQVAYIIFRIILSVHHPELFYDLLNWESWLKVFTSGIKFCGMLWYMNALIQALIVIYLLTRFKLLKVLPVLAFLGLCGNLTFGEFATHWYDYSVHRNALTIALPCLFLGMAVRLNQHKIQLSTRTLALIFAAVSVALVYEYSRFNFHTNFDCVIFTLPATTLLFIITLRLNAPLTNLAARPGSSLTRKCCDGLVCIGRDHSANIYLIHDMVRKTLPYFRHYVPPKNTLLVFAISLLISIALRSITALCRKDKTKN